MNGILKNMLQLIFRFCCANFYQRPEKEKGIRVAQVLTDLVLLRYSFISFHKRGYDWFPEKSPFRTKSVVTFSLLCLCHNQHYFKCQHFNDPRSRHRCRLQCSDFHSMLYVTAGMESTQYIHFTAQYKSSNARCMETLHFNDRLFYTGIQVSIF